MPTRLPTRRWTGILLLGAALWSAGLLLAGCLVGVGIHVVVRTTLVGGVEHRSVFTQPATTLLAQDGGRVLVLLAVPLLATGVVAWSLGWRRRHGRPGPGVLAWAAVTVVGALVLLGALSVGPFVLPVPALLAGACASAIPRAQQLSAPERA